MHPLGLAIELQSQAIPIETWIGDQIDLAVKAHGPQDLHVGADARRQLAGLYRIDRFAAQASPRGKVFLAKLTPNARGTNPLPELRQTGRDRCGQANLTGSVGCSHEMHYQMQSAS